MPTPRVLMSKIRQALQLLAGDAGLSRRQVAAALGVSKTTISEIAMYARDAGVDWPLASTLSDDELQVRLYPPPRPRSTARAEPDCAAVHQELKRPGVTLQLLWEEYRAHCGDGAGLQACRCIHPDHASWGQRAHLAGRDAAASADRRLPHGRAAQGPKHARLARDDRPGHLRVPVRRRVHQRYGAHTRGQQGLRCRAAGCALPPVKQRP